MLEIAALRFFSRVRWLNNSITCPCGGFLTLPMCRPREARAGPMVKVLVRCFFGAFRGVLGLAVRVLRLVALKGLQTRLKMGPLAVRAVGLLEDITWGVSETPRPEVQHSVTKLFR